LKRRRIHVISKKWIVALCSVGVLAFGVAACGDDDDDDGGSSGGGDLSGEISIDGSSTVEPFAQAAAELFNEENPDVNITVGAAGTSGGFEKFCAGETDSQTPLVRSTRRKRCRSARTPESNPLRSRSQTTASPW